MNYPLISEYIDAIINAEENLDRLSNLRPVMNVNGMPIMSSGNFAVVFKMTDGTKEYALKCFLKDQIGREDAYRMICKELKSGGVYEMVRVEYFDNELFVDTKQSTCNEFPVVCMDWEDGVTMDNWLILNADKKETLVKFYNSFHKLCVDLLCSHVAHGDIKPDNILVQGDGYYSFILIDLDGMFVPEMTGSKARENGTPEYSHPRRKELPYDEHIDDYACIIMLLALKISIETGNDYSLIIEKGVELMMKECPEIRSNKEISTLYIAYQYTLLHGRIDKPLIPYLLGYITDEQHSNELNFKYQAKEGNTTAMLSLSSYYRSIGDFSNAYKWADFAYKLGNVNAECQLCKLYRSDYDLILHGGRPHFNHAFNMLKTNNIPFALCYKVEEKAFTKSFQERESDFKYAADKGSIGAESWLGAIYSGKDEAKSLFYLKSAAAKGLSSAQRKLGQHYLENKEYDTAFEYFLLAANQDDEESMCKIGMMHEHGWGVNKSYKEAILWYEKASAQDSYAAQRLADFYRTGTGVNRNYFKAIELYKKSNNTVSKYWIGMFYSIKNEACELDLNYAYSMFLKSAKQDYAPAMARLGQIEYETHPDKAIEWWDKAIAEQHDAESMYFMGLHYDNPHIGYEKNMNKAIEYMENAASYGFKDAITWLRNNKIKH